MNPYSERYIKGSRTKALNKLKKLLEEDSLHVYSISTSAQPEGFWIGLTDPFWNGGKFTKLIFIVGDKLYEKPSPFSPDKRFISGFHNEAIETLASLLKLHMQYENEIQKKFILSTHGNELFPEKPFFEQLDAQLAAAEFGSENLTDDSQGYQGGEHLASDSLLAHRYPDHEIDDLCF